MSRLLAEEYHTATLCCQKRRSSLVWNISRLLSGQEIRSLRRQVMASKLRILCDKAQIAKYLFSGFLALLTGYGFRMWRIIIVYLALILAFAGAYYGVGVQHAGDISFWQALIVSVTAFHGRVFTNPFTPNIPDGQVIITALEAVVGLIIEGVFIAMLTQWFFNR